MDNFGARGKVAPLSPERYALQLTLGKRGYDDLRYAQALLGHQVPSGDIAQVTELAYELLVAELEKRKLGSGGRRRGRQGSAEDPRYIPSDVKRVVWERDGAQCTFVAEGGRRCEARTRLEFDHIDPRARGGQSTVDGLRLRCRAHNQYEAECMFGAVFMANKRAEARAAAAEKKRKRAEEAEQKAAERERERAEAAAQKAAEAELAAAEQDPDRSVVPWLRKLGFRLEEARRAATHCESMGGASLERRVRAGLRFLTASNGRLVTSPRPGEVQAYSRLTTMSVMSSS